MFKANKNAEELYVKAVKPDAYINAEDDFGTRAFINLQEVAAISFSEYENDMERNGKLGLIQHKAQLKAQKEAEQDVGLQILNQPSKIMRN